MTTHITAQQITSTQKNVFSCSWENGSFYHDITRAMEQLYGSDKFSYQQQATTSINTLLTFERLVVPPSGSIMQVTIEPKATCNKHAFYDFHVYIQQEEIGYGIIERCIVSKEQISAKEDKNSAAQIKHSTCPACGTVLSITHWDQENHVLICSHCQSQITITGNEMQEIVWQPQDSYWRE